ncbi:MULTISPECIES: hypothetical protein [unclassified Chryseobacterium]|jgi:hypothetical protein|uniref:hypothetical protein n=1 Tax=unclassified Chryseobacterium TaxID=2593645 RepID=UPI001C5B05F5|nr:MULTISPECIES: hypothetical protein [unclassified Chryseobacterium]MBW3524588.1 hypothetical protein [Chryseobacterium sp. NKUCC03_KSP]MCD0455031.1 hypothetical protein [Chryseobacterium sp. LC2016-27]
MKTKQFYKYLLIIGGSMIPLSMIMFIFGISMFTARGDFSSFVIQLSQFCFIFWMPVFVLGIILLIIGSIMQKRNI